MLKKNRRKRLGIGLSTAAVFIGMLNPPPAHAFAYMTCTIGDTDIVRWSGKSMGFRFSSVSFPQGSARANALDLARQRWNHAPGGFTFHNTVFGDTSIGRNNSENEAWFSEDPELMEDATGKALIRYSCATGNVKEVDIVFRADPDKNKEDNVQRVWSFTDDKLTKSRYGGTGVSLTSVAVHEMGHALGVHHVNTEYNVMGDSTGHVHTNAQTIRPYAGEDAGAGEVFLYGPTANSLKEDLSVSHWLYAGVDGEYSDHDLGRVLRIVADSTFVLNSSNFEGERRYEVFRGVAVNPEFTYENNGLNKQTLNVGYYISTNDLVTTKDRLIKSETLTLTPGNVAHRAPAVTIPSDLVVGQTYWLGVVIDTSGQLEEFSEANNGTRIPVRIAG